VLVPILISLFAWWFFTGLILLLVNRAGRIGKAGYEAVVVLTVPFLALSVFGVVWSSFQATLTGVYVGFLSALGVWGWIELAFLTGVVTGPSRFRCPPETPGLLKFGLAIRALLHHEIAVLIGFAALVLMTWGAENTVGMWTYCVLFFARISAKMNIYLGVPNINIEFLPAPVKHLETYFTVGPMNRFFPLSVTLLTLATGCWMERAITAPDQIAQSGYVLLATLTSLALLEHWFMVVRLPDAALWRWLLSDTKSPSAGIDTIKADR
jgi:putative photosynthetic complex assembly protein 2